MTILLTPTGTDGSAPTGTGNNARISLVIDAPAGESFAGITAAGTALKSLEKQLDDVNKKMKDLGLKKFPDIGKTVTDQGKKMADAAAGVDKLTSSLEELGKVKTKITKGGELLGGTVETKPFSTGTFKINDKGQAEEIKTKQDLLAQRKSWSKNLDDQNKTEEREQAAADARWKAHADETLREQQEFKNKRESINRKNDFPVTDADAALKRSTADKIARQKLEAKSVAGAGKDFIRIQQESEERKAQARRDAISDSKTQLVEDVNTAKARKATSLTGLKHASGPHADNVARANAEKAYQEEVLKASEQYHARAKTLGDVAGQRAGATAYANAQVKVAEATRQAHIETARLNESYSHIGKNMLQNIAHVTAWSASVGVLYGSLRLLKESVGSMIELQYQQARLSVVMGLSQSETTGLTDEILRLAAANGRSGDDAMKAATQWARLGMTKQQVAEATKVSLMAANVAEITAAEATESLSAIMVTYGLRAAQLNGVLGMLNQTSNNYNVTVGELLSGLERVSSVAKQAGLSLAETQGIIGAAAGATGQTGANIGNSLKSFIGAVAGEEGQKNLRSFGIEATAGGEMKGMTQIVNDLYVAYQRMSEAERRTMIFSTVGKNQAARVTAMLDNYVKSQVLAANSLSNLNSAGNENAVILDTMKSRLQGVITEWQRFVMLQSRNVGFVASAGGKIPGGGPVTETMNAVSNMGKLANTGVGSVGATIIVGLLTAAMMRLGVATAMNAYKSQDWTAKGGILKETAKAMAVSVRDLGLAFRNAGQAAQMSAVDFDAMGRKAKFAASGMGLLKSGAKGLAGLAGGFVAFEIIGAAFNAFSDWVKKATGNTGDFVTEAGDNLADLSNTAGRSAEAYAIAARLFQTSSDALAESVNKPATMSGILSQMDGLDATIPGIEAKFQGLKDNVVGFTAALNAAKIDAKTEQWIAQARSINHLNDAIAQYKARIESLKRGDGAMLQSSRAKEIQEFEKKLAQAQADKVKTVSGVRSGMDADRKAYAESSATSLAFLDAQKIVLGEINTLYKQLAENSDHSFQQSAEAARLRTEADLIKNQVDLITKRNALLYDALSIEERRDPTERIQGLENTTREQVAAHRKQIADLRPTAPGVDVEWGGVPITTAQSEAQIAKLQEEIITLQKALRAESAKITEFATTNPFIQELTGNRAAIAKLPVNESEGAARAAAKAEQERIQADRIRFRQEALAATERARVDSSGSGTNEFEKWSARKAYLDRQREMFNQREMGGGNTADTRAEQLEREKMAHGQIKDAMVQRETLEGKVTQHVAERTKEYRKQLMMMGPGELLTSLALRKMGPNMTGGQLLSLAPSARKLWTDMPGNDAETREMRGALKGFQNLKLGPDDAQKSMEKIAADMRALLNDIKKDRQPALAPFAKELVDMLFKAEIPVVNVRGGVVNVAGPAPAPVNNAIPRVSPADPVFPFGGARASGGPVEKGRTYLVGEKGPELVKMSGNGTVIPNGMESLATAAAGGASNPWDGNDSKRWLKFATDMAMAWLRDKSPEQAAKLGKWVGFAGAALEGGRLAYDYKGQTGKVEEASKGGYWASLKQGLGSPMTTIATAGNLFRDINALNHENVSTSDSIAARNKAIENKKHEMAMRPRNWNRNVQRDAADRIPVPESPVGFDALETPSGMFENNPSNYDPSNYDQNLGGAKFYTGGGATDMAEEKSRPKYQTQLKKGEISHPSGALPNRQSIPEVNRFPIVSQDFQHPDWKTPERDPESTDFENGGDVSRQTSANADARRKPQDMTRQSRAYRPTQTIRPYANVPQPGRQTGRPQQAAAAAPRIPVAGNNAPVGGGAPAQGQGGGFPAVMAAASAAVATFSGAISTAAANVTLFSTALTAAMAQMGPRTAFSGAPANADNPFS